ncbi:MAG: response regulator [Thermoplasmatota archaeon]
MNGNNIEIVLVEDNPKDVELTLHALQKHNLANKVHVARDGQEALDFFFGPDAAERSGKPRLVLLDLKLPKVSGIDVLRALKGDPRTKAIPVVVLTSSTVDRDMTESYQVGVNSYLRKPIDFNEFVEAAKTLGLYWLLMNRVPP